MRGIDAVAACLGDLGGLRLSANAALRPLNSFGIEARAHWLIEAHEPGALCTALARIDQEGWPLVLLGGGSNVLILDDLPLVLRPRLQGIAFAAPSAGQRQVRVAAGESWHGFVGASLQAGAYGLENLALIPGDCGAAPIQNIGAYGVELEQFVVAVEVYDRQRGEQVLLSHAECQFRYRDSVFKHEPDRYVVLALHLGLACEPHLKLDYAGIGEELRARGVGTPSAQDVHDAVVAIRRRKLPDPAQIGNAGSFFKNPIVPRATAEALRAVDPQLPVYPVDASMAKLAAGYLIESCGWKGHREGDAGVHAAHALVLVNHGQASGRDILALAQRIQDSVATRYGITLEMEAKALTSPQSGLG